MGHEKESWTITTTPLYPAQDGHPSSRQQPPYHDIQAHPSKERSPPFPYYIYALVSGSILCWVLMGIVLYQSHDKIVDDWYIMPSVYLSTLSVISVNCCRAAYTRASAIEWWVQVNKLNIKSLDLQTGLEDDADGSQLGELEEDNEKDIKEKLRKAHEFWESTNSWRSALASVRPGKTFNILSLACLILTILPASSPLVQRASHAGPLNKTFSRSFPIPSREALPIDFTGTFDDDHNLSATGLTPDFIEIVQLWNTGFAMFLEEEVKDCYVGDCRGNVIGIGLTSNCYNTTYSKAHFAPVSEPSDIFNVTFSDSSKNDVSTSLIDLSVVYKGHGTEESAPDSCFFTINTTFCELSPAVMNYSIVTDGYFVSLDPKTHHYDDKVFRNITELHPSSWGGLLLLLSNAYDTSTTLSYSTRNKYTIDRSSGTLSFLYIDDPSLSPCERSWTDPTRDLLDAVRQIMFLTALYPQTINDNRANQMANVTSTSQLSVFQADYLFLGASLIVSSLSVIIIIILTLNWRSLEGKVDLSPVSLIELIYPKLQPKEHHDSEDSRFWKLWERLFS